MEKLDALVQKLKEVGDSYLMFSGGLDSCAILGAAQLAQVKVTPVWINNGFGRANEYLINKQAGLLGNNDLKVILIEPEETVLYNPVDRCYHCKGQIISAIKKISLSNPIMDGTTGSDNGYRPGRKALNEYGVISPLAELDISSTEAKDMALKMGADKSIADLESCLATRVNYNLPLTVESLQVVREIEQSIINETGDFNVRCRLDDTDHVRIELASEESYTAVLDKDFREKLVKLGQQVAMFTTIDLQASRPNAYDARIKK